MNDVMETLNEVVEYLQERGVGQVDCGVILGTGLGDLASKIEVEKEWSYNQIPHLPVASVEFHFGRLLYGKLGGKWVLAWQGRFHYYEGYTMEQVVMPVRITRLLGGRAMLISNAAGALNPEHDLGDLMCIEDHINLQPDNPLRGPNVNELGSRFPDLYRAYHLGLRTALHRIAEAQGTTLRAGIYASVAGPHLETPAEYRYLRTIGADAVGMSTAPEVIACAHMGMPCAAISVLTDACDPERLAPVVIEEILATAQKSEGALSRLFEQLIVELDEALVA